MTLSDGMNPTVCREASVMISAYKEFQIYVESVACEGAARAQVHRDGAVVPFALLDDAIWVYAADCAAAEDLARFFIDKTEHLILPPNTERKASSASQQEDAPAAPRSIPSKSDTHQPYSEAI